MTVEEFQKEYGGVKEAHIYRDCEVAVTVNYNISEFEYDKGYSVSTFLIDKSEIEKVDIVYGQGAEYIDTRKSICHRIDDSVVINGSKSINVKTKQLKQATATEKEFIESVKAQSSQPLKRNGLQLLEKNNSLKAYSSLADNSSVLTAKEINGRFYLAVKEINDGVESLYCFIFDSKSEEALYAAELTAVKGSGSTFVLAEPVMTAEKGYYEFI